MGYSNVTGDLNVQSTISSQNVYVFGSTNLNTLTTNDGVTVNGTLSVPGNSTFGKITTSNLTVTGNFTVTTTNTAFSNALSVNNSGTATALKVVQFESGGGGHTYNVAEFWDFTRMAMVIDPEGNVGIHTTNTGTFGLSVADGANVDSLQALTVSTGILSTPLANVTTLNVGTLANLNLVNVSSELTTTLFRADNSFLGTINAITTNSLTYVTTNNLYAANSIQTTNVLASIVNASNNLYAANALQTTNVLAVTGNVTYLVATNNVYAANAVRTTNVLTVTLNASNNVYAANALFTTNVLATTANLTTGNTTYLVASNNVYAANAVLTTNVLATTVNTTTGNAVYVVASNNVYAANSIQTTNVYATTSNLTTSNAVYIVASNNVYAANSIQTTNVYATTSNVTTGNATYLVALNNVFAANAVFTTNVYAVTSNVTTGNATYLVASNNVYAANSLFATNVYATTANLTTGNAVYLVALNNVYAANSLSATNVYATTSNVTTGNATYLVASNNVYAANSLFATNVYATTANLTTGNAVYLVALNNVYAANSLSATNVYATTSNVTTGNASTFIALNNVFAANAIQTTNVIATTINTTTLNIVSEVATNNVYAANSIQTTNVYASTANLTTGNASTFIALNNVYAANAMYTTNLTSTGNTSISNMKVQSFNFTVASGAGSYTNVCSIVDNPNGSGIYAISAEMMTRGVGGSAMTKTYIFTCNYISPISATWTRVIPFSRPSGNNQIGLDARTSGGTTVLRATNLNANEVVSVGIVLRVSSTSFSTVAITDLTTQSDVGATSTGFFPSSVYTQNNGLVGISTETPTSNLHVVGNIYASNSIQTTNVYATTSNVTTDNATFVVALNNVYAANSIQTTNVYATTSNVTTDNATFVVALNNVYAANSLFTTNVYATTSNVTTGNATYLVALNNVYAANAVFTTNVLATVITASSNVNAPTINAATMNTTTIYGTSSGYLGINKSSPAFTLDVGGNINFSGSLYQGGTLYIGSQWTTGTGNIYYVSNVGIGTSAVSSNLSVSGNVYVSNAVQTTNVLASVVNAATMNTTTIYGTSSGYLGINKSSPAFTLDVGGNINFSGSLYQGGTLYIGSQWTTGTGNIYYVSNVGIGTSAVSSNLSVSGNVYVSNGVQTNNLIAAQNIYGPITGSNTISCSTLYGAIAGSNTISASTFYGVIAGSNTISGSTITGSTLLGVISGSNTISASSLTLSSALAISYGGTGQTTASAAFNALSPLTTLGDLIYGGASGTASRLPGNTTSTKNFLVQTGNGTVSGAPTWGTIGVSDVPTLNQNTTGSAGSLSTTYGTGQILYGQGSGVPTSTSTFVYSGGNVGIGTNILGSNLTVSGNVFVSNSITTTNVIATGTIYGVWNGTSQGTLLTLGTNLTTGTAFATSVDAPTLQAYHVPLQSFTQNAIQAVSGYTITGQGLIKFSSVGLYQLTVVFVMDSPVVKVALGTNSTSTFPSTTSGYTYVYNVSSAASPSDCITIPINVQNITNYYYLDVFCRSSVTSGTYYLTAGTTVTGSQNGTYIQIAPFGNYISSGQNASSGLLVTTSGTTLSTALAQNTPLTTASNTYHVTMTSSSGWTSTGASSSIQISPNGNLQFLQAGVYNVTVCLNPSLQPVLQVGIGSTSSDASLPSTIGPYLYQYAPTYSQDPSATMVLPIAVTDTTKYYYLDATFGPSTSVSILSTSTFVSVTPLASYIPSPMATSSLVVSQVVTAQPTSYTALSTDSYIGMSNGGTVTLPQGATLTRGKVYTIKEESGKAGTNTAYNIIIQTQGVDTIDGQSNVYVQLAYTSVNVMWTGANNKWSLI